MKKGLTIRTMALVVVSVVTILATVAQVSAQRVREITLWTTEEQPERMAVQEDIAAKFAAETGIQVKVVPVSENQLGERATAAYAGNDLPDIIYTPLNNVLNWVEEGIIDTDAVAEAIDDLGKGTFASGVLALVETEDGYGGVPVDGWTQLLVYRKDLFEAKGLEPPKDYESILAAIKVLHDPPNLYGFVAATDTSQVYMMQVFEHLALANGATIIDSNGKVKVNTTAMVEAIDFYKKLAEASPEGNLFWQQSRELYLAGKAAMIVWSPFIMDELAGLRDAAPVTFTSDPTSADLARRTGFLTRISGPSNPGGAGWADVRYLAITVDASTREAKQFVDYSMNEGYVQTLAIAPEGKFPVRRGDKRNATRFVEEWSNLQVGVDRKKKLSELYSADVINNVVAGLETGSRWGFRQGYGALTSKLYETRVFAELVRQNIDGEISARRAASLMQREAEALR